MSLRAEREQEAATRRRTRWRAGTAICVVVAVVVGMLLLAGGRPVPPGRSVYDAGTTDPVAAAVPVLAGFTEQTRGLLFRQPPVVLVVDPVQFERSTAEPAVPAAGDRSATLRALALPVRPAPGPRPPVRYSPGRRAVLVRQGTPIDADTRVRLVHELTHALQDQAFGLVGPAARAAPDADRARALAALVEGDATRVELAYLATLPAGEQAAIRSGRSAPARSYLQLDRAFPVTAGLDFVTALVRRGGNAAVDAAFARPPTSTAQVLDPAAYEAGVQPLGVRAPAGEGRRVDAGTLGRFGLAALVTGGRRVLNAGAAGRWLGDSYGTFVSRAGVCTYANIVVADTEAREQLVGDLARWVGARGGRAGVTRSTERGVRLRSCA